MFTLTEKEHGTGMSFKKRLGTIIIIGVILIATIVATVLTKPISQGSGESILSLRNKETIYIWYTDESLTAYISSAAVSYGESRNVRVIPVLESGSGYLENINAASLTQECPDLYIASHDTLEKAYLAGLAEQIVLTQRVILDEAYPQAAIDAVSYHDKVLGYPFYFETSSLLYNKTYLEEMAKGQLEKEADEAAALESLEDLEEFGPDNGTEMASDEQDRDESMPDLEETPVIEEISEEEQQKINERVQELIPETIEDIKIFADEYDAPEQVEAVFKWDVNDIFYNYFFVGNTMVIGGDAGDDINQIDIYNQQSINSMRMYQELNQFFAIDTTEVDYSAILDDFISGKIVFTVATSDAVGRLEQAREDGMFAYEYGITKTPDINEQTPVRSLSMTNCVVVNAYSEKQEIANDFAWYLTTVLSDNLYARTGKIAAAYGTDYGYENLNAYFEEYTTSIPMPKMIETSNFWIQLEITFAQIWDGADVNDSLKKLSEQIMTQIIGEPYTEEKIEEDITEDTVEYLDEEQYRQEAMEE